MAVDEVDDIADAVARLHESERGGFSVDAVASTWRFAGIVDPIEVRSWLSAGVFDGHRAGLLRMSGVTPAQLLALPHARQIGLDFALGRLSVIDVRTLLSNAPAPEKSFVRARALSPDPLDEEPAPDSPSGTEGR